MKLLAVYMFLIINMINLLFSKIYYFFIHSTLFIIFDLFNIFNIFEIILL